MGSLAESVASLAMLHEWHSYYIAAQSIHIRNIHVHLLGGQFKPSIEKKAGDLFD